MTLGGHFMLDRRGFDQWAGEYDESIATHEKGYPFEGYYDVLSDVHQRVKKSEQTTVLDIGVGTGLLTHALCERRCQIHGINFSPKMLGRAKQKMPNGRFYCHDLTQGLPQGIRDETYDYIVSSYVLHHLDHGAKVTLLQQLYQNHLKARGKIIIADISFNTRQELEDCRKEARENWDEDEHYIVVMSYTQRSVCEPFNRKCSDRLSEGQIWRKEMGPMVLIREAVEVDAVGIGKVHVDSWRTTYKGIVPKTYLDNLSPDSRHDVWSAAIQRADRYVYVAENEKEEIVGFISGGENRERESGFESELYAIYLLDAYQRLQIGRRLTHALVRRLIRAGFSSMLVWVLADNPSRIFYERLGGKYYTDPTARDRWKAIG